MSPHDLWQLQCFLKLTPTHRHQLMTPKVKEMYGQIHQQISWIPVALVLNRIFCLAMSPAVSRLQSTNQILKLIRRQRQWMFHTFKQIRFLRMHILEIETTSCRPRRFHPRPARHLPLLHLPKNILVKNHHLLIISRPLHHNLKCKDISIHLQHSQQ